MDVHAHLAGAYERAAPTYDRAAFSHHAQLGERLAQMVLLGPGGRVLDVGCGAGGALLPAAQRVGPTGEAVGIDLSEGHGRAHARGGGGRARAGARRGDGRRRRSTSRTSTSTPCCARSRSAAIPDAAGALAEMRRVLRPTGTIGVALWDEP